MRYFFHTEDGQAFPDDEGIELPSLAAAKQAALKFLGEIIRDVDDFWDSGLYKVIVKNDRGVTLFTLDLTGTVMARPRLVAPRP